ncbi:heavy-metal-associated domain-containing protein [Streptomyces kanasensis]|uniref:heavy-metal-associated domain-containing protein n=1 Tax=Streptomyces kanasensis TaxID=936756 RepID=UPI0036F6E247
MTAETTKNELPQVGAGSCCSSAGAGHAGAAGEQAADVTTVYEVKGMSCGHCEGAVSEELSALDGVTSVRAVASTGKVTVVSQAPLDEEAVRAAVDEAGYELLGTA